MRSAIDGRVVNAGAKLYRKFNNKHLEPLAGEIVGEDGVLLLRAHLPVEHSCRAGGANASVRRRRASSKARADAHRGTGIHRAGTRGRAAARARRWCWRSSPLFYTSRDQAISECGLAARKAIARAGRFDAVLAEHVACLEAPVAPLRRASAAGRTGIQAERADAAAA